MGVSLKKGEGISLRKEENDLSTLTIGLGWDVAKPKGFLGKLFNTQEDYDLDAIAFLLGKNGKVNHLGKKDSEGYFSLVDGDIIFFNSMRHRSGKIWLTGDNRDGSGDGDDEQIIVKLNELPDEYQSIVFVVSIYQGIEKKQNFGNIENAFIRAVDAKGKEVCRFDISGNSSFSQYHSLVFAEVSRENGGWRFQAIGTPHAADRFDILLQNYLD